MARIESIAIGGDYPTPPHIVQLITGFFESKGNWTLVDPCAGEGAAIYALRAHTGGYLAAVEMEANRHKVLAEQAKWSDKIAHGDFFHLKFTNDAADILYLNPPYDLDKVFVRLEERFLQRATPMLAAGGVLVFVVPYYALAASAKTLSQYYRDLHCYRFPDSDWDAYKQVVLFGKRARNPLPDQYLEDQVRGWASDPATMPVLGSSYPEKLYAADPHRYRHLSEWTIIGADLEPARNLNPWAGANGFDPPTDLYAAFHKEYPLASHPRASHIAAALSAGVFNGITVQPDRPGFPQLMVKGVFDREWKTIEEKVNNQGQTVAEVQVQQPKLFVSILNMETGGMHAIRQEAYISDSPSVDSLTMGDLLDIYGKSLMHGMLKSCPVLFDPNRDQPVELPDLGRSLFPAQADAVQTIIRLHEQNPQRGAVVLGEIGSGKSSVALATAEALHKDCLLIVAPPHLMDSWRDQTAAVLPNRTYHVLESLVDVDAFFSLDHPRVGVISRERAKLSHGWETIAGVCPHCGTKLPAIDYAKSRSKCEGYTIHPKNALARWLLKFAHTLAPWLPTHPIIQQLCVGRMWDVRLAKYAKQPRLDPMPIQDLLQELASMSEIGQHGDVCTWLAWYKPELAPTILGHMGEGTSRGLVMLTQDPDHKIEFPVSLYSYLKQDWDRAYQYMWFGEGHPGWTYSKVSPRQELDSIALCSKEALYRLLDSFNSGVVSYKRKTCNEFLYQAVPEPRRYPLAKYISQRYRNSYDMLIVDEAHEFSNITSAQTKAAQRLMGSKKAFTLLLTGSFMNGYAESVFMNMQAISPDFRKAFQRDDVTSFIDRFGYWKQTVSEKDAMGKVVEFGKNSDRVIRSARKSGVAPGILPVFQLEHLLPIAVTLQKEDLKLGIPPCTESVTSIAPTPLMLSNYNYLMKELLAEIKRTRTVEGRSGKLWGALAELPSYLDLAAIGEPYEIRWPESVDGSLITSVPSMDPSTILPKEEWMLNHVANEVSQGRRVIVMGWHLKLLPRYVKLLSARGFRVAHLESSKVPTDKRQDWIDKHVIAKKVDVLVVNPVTVQTGLNNLVYFATELWMENPMCSPFVYRQACGRVDRIGQQLDTKIMFPIYEDTAQEELHQLLMHKVGVSKSVDGLDPEEALRAAGVLDSEYSGFSLGKQIYHMIMR